jgi:hypothetical protein
VSKAKKSKQTTAARIAQAAHLKKQEAFLDAYAKLGTVLAAAKAAGIGRRTHYDWLEKDTKYAKQFENVHREFCDSIEHEIFRRGVVGVDKPVMHQGKPVYHPDPTDPTKLLKDPRTGLPVQVTIKDYSDTLLIFRAKGEMPEKYRDKFEHEHTGKGGGPIEFEDVKRALKSKLDRLAARAGATAVPQ